MTFKVFYGTFLGQLLWLPSPIRLKNWRRFVRESKINGGKTKTFCSFSPFYETYMYTQYLLYEIL